MPISQTKKQVRKLWAWLKNNPKVVLKVIAIVTVIAKIVALLALKDPDADFHDLLMRGIEILLSKQTP